MMYYYQFAFYLTFPFLLIHMFGNFVLWNLCCNYLKKNIFHFISFISFQFTSLSDYSILRFSRWCKTQTVKSSQKKLQNRTINLPKKIFSAHTLICQACFFIHFVEHLPLVRVGKNYYSFHVLFLTNWHKRTTKVWKENTDICG